MNGEPEWTLNYESNSFPRMGSFFFGLFVGLFATEGHSKFHDRGFEERLARKIRNSSKTQYIFHFIGLSLIIVNYSLISLYFGASPMDGPTTSSYLYLILCPLAFLIGLTLFLLPCIW